MEPCKLEYRETPITTPWWCVEHGDDPAHYHSETNDWVCDKYVIGKQSEKRPQDAALRALEALSEALKEADEALWYTSGNDIAMTALTTVRGAVDKAIETLKDV